MSPPALTVSCLSPVPAVTSGETRPAFAFRIFTSGPRSSGTTALSPWASRSAVSGSFHPGRAWRSGSRGRPLGHDIHHLAKAMASAQRPVSQALRSVNPNPDLQILIPQIVLGIAI